MNSEILLINKVISLGPLKKSRKLRFSVKSDGPKTLFKTSLQTGGTLKLNQIPGETQHVLKDQ